MTNYSQVLSEYRDKTMAKKILFIDRDGTLIHEPEDFQVDALEKVKLVEGVIPALLRLRDHGYRFVMVSNQDGLGTNAFPTEQFEQCHTHLLDILRSQGIKFDEIFICPHLPEDRCDCRKPATGLLTAYLAKTALDLERCAVIGDRETDIELAKRLAIPGFLVSANGDYAETWPGIADCLCSADRKASIARNTRETKIRCSVNLDSSVPTAIDTGIGFFDHMLEQIARHGGFSLDVKCSGDLHIDEHHTVEDVALCLGTALREALGDKRGIGRYGFVLPMDESEAHTAIDLSGRSSFVFEGKFPRDQVGTMSTEMVRHFFQSLADALGAAIHIRVSGENTHHMVEACFKSVGRALRPALQIESNELPSTKGILH